ncbi:MAG: hypothetical protein EXS48_02720 [Candidatus Staskawiczbacteria bacterium]|nr:hypothetical protein [Candidatus Staskawiczbacteria bacterium]
MKNKIAVISFILSIISTSIFLVASALLFTCGLDCQFSKNPLTHFLYSLYGNPFLFIIAVSLIPVSIILAVVSLAQIKNGKGDGKKYAIISLLLNVSAILIGVFLAIIMFAIASAFKNMIG